jgi:hypothetical protein
MDQLKNKRTLILLGLTIAAAAFLASDFFLSSPKARHASRKASDPPAVARAIKKAKAAQQKVAAAPKATAGRHLAPPPAPDQPWGRRDPFGIGKNQLSHGPKPVVQFKGFRLTGIVWGPKGYQALVNEYVVRVGDQVNGARVVSITKEGVELAKDGQTHFLPLIPKGRFQ